VPKSRSTCMIDEAARSSVALVFGARIGIWSLDLGLCDRFTTRKEGFLLLIYMTVILVILWNLNLFEKPTSVQTIHFTVSEWGDQCLQTATLTFGSSPKPHIMRCTVASMYPSIKKREKKDSLKNIESRFSHLHCCLAERFLAYAYSKLPEAVKNGPSSPPFGFDALDLV